MPAANANAPHVCIHTVLRIQTRVGRPGSRDRAPRSPVERRAGSKPGLL